MQRMSCHSIDLQGRPLEIGSVIKINGMLYAVISIKAPSSTDISIHLEKL